MLHLAPGRPFQNVYLLLIQFTRATCLVHPIFTDLTILQIKRWVKTDYVITLVFLSFLSS